VLLGFGASAIGALPNGYVQNAAQLGAYRDAVAGGHLPTAHGICLGDDDRLRRDIIEQLMCGFSVDRAATAAWHRLDAGGFANEFIALRALADDGLVRIGSRIKVPTEGRPPVRCAAAVFDLYLDSAASRHAVAV
jgi:oxygen-independent coproporphyrinogen-3 oxidase